MDRTYRYAAAALVAAVTSGPYLVVSPDDTARLLVAALGVGLAWAGFAAGVAFERESD